MAGFMQFLEHQWFRPECFMRSDLLRRRHRGGCMGVGMAPEEHCLPGHGAGSPWACRPDGGSLYDPVASCCDLCHCPAAVRAFDSRAARGSVLRC